MKGVNYLDTFILVADDCRADHGTEPPVKSENPSIAARQYEMIATAPYTFTSEDVIFGVHADRTVIDEQDRPAARAEYFSIGRACLRASNLGKKYGWGIHCDAEGKLALYGVESPEYARLVAAGDNGECPALVKAMRSSRT